MTNPSVPESVRTALAAFNEQLEHKYEFIEANGTDGEPLCGYDDWDENIADHDERLAELGEHLADAVAEMIGAANA